MYKLLLLTLLYHSDTLSNHNSYDWKLTCDEWNQARVEILSDQYHTSDAKEYLIDYFRTKVSDEQCETWQIGRK